MNNFLAIETSTHACSIALHWQGETHVCHEVQPKQHNALIFPLIKKLLTAADIQLNQLDALVCGIGPGSFVGVRIAVGVIQGMALGTHLPVIPIPSLQTLAQGIYNQFSDPHVWVIQDARINQVYSQRFILNTDTQTMSPESELFACHPEELHFVEKTDWTPVGNGWESYKEDISLPLVQWLESEKVNFLPNAADMLPLAQHIFDAGSLLTPEQIEPIYIRGTNPWKKSN